MKTMQAAKLDPSPLVSMIESLPKQGRKEVLEYLGAYVIQKLVSEGKFRKAIEIAEELEANDLLPPLAESYVEKIRKLEELRSLLKYAKEIFSKAKTVEDLINVANNASVVNDLANKIDRIAADLGLETKYCTVSNALRDLARWSTVLKTIVESYKKLTKEINSKLRSMMNIYNTSIDSLDDLTMLVSLAINVPSRIRDLINEVEQWRNSMIYGLIDVTRVSSQQGITLSDFAKKVVDIYANSLLQRLRNAEIASEIYAKLLFDLMELWQWVANLVHVINEYNPNKGYVLGNRNYVDLLKRTAEKLDEAWNRLENDIAWSYSELNSITDAKLVEGLRKLIHSIEKMSALIKSRLADVVMEACKIDPRFYDVLIDYLRKAGMSIQSPYTGSPLKVWYEDIQRAINSLLDQTRLAFLAGIRNINKEWWGLPLAIIGSIAELGAGAIALVLSSISPLHVYEALKSMFEIASRAYNHVVVGDINGAVTELSNALKGMFGTPMEALENAGMILLGFALPEVLSRLGLGYRLSEVVSSILTGDPFTPLSVAIESGVRSIARVMRATIEAKPGEISRVFHELPSEELEKNLGKAFTKALAEEGIKLTEDVKRALILDFISKSSRIKSLTDLRNILGNEAAEAVIKSISNSFSELIKYKGMIESAVSTIEDLSKRISSILKEMEGSLSHENVLIRKQVLQTLEKVKSASEEIKKASFEIRHVTSLIRSVEEAEKELAQHLGFLPPELRKIVDQVLSEARKSLRQAKEVEKAVENLRKVYEELEKGIEVAKRKPLRALITSVIRKAVELRILSPDALRLLKEGRYVEAINELAKALSSKTERELFAFTKLREAIKDLESSIESLAKALEPLRPFLTRVRTIENIVVRGSEAEKIFASALAKDLEKILSLEKELKKVCPDIDFNAIRSIVEKLRKGEIVTVDALNKVFEELANASPVIATYFTGEEIMRLASLAEKLFGSRSPLVSTLKDLAKKISVSRTVMSRIVPITENLEDVVKFYAETVRSLEEVSPELKEVVGKLVNAVNTVVEKMRKGEPVSRTEIAKLLRELESIESELRYVPITIEAKNRILAGLRSVIDRIRMLTKSGKLELAIARDLAEDLALVARRLEKIVEEEPEIPNNYIVIEKVGTVREGTMIAAPKSIAFEVEKLLKGWDTRIVTIDGLRIVVKRRMIPLRDGTELIWRVEIPNAGYIEIRVRNHIIARRGRKATWYRDVTVEIDPKLRRVIERDPHLRKIFDELSHERAIDVIREIDPEFDDLSRVIVIRRGVSSLLRYALRFLDAIPFLAMIYPLMVWRERELRAAEQFMISPQEFEEIVSMAKPASLPTEIAEAFKDIGVVPLFAIKLPQITTPIVIAVGDLSKLAPKIVGTINISLNGLTIRIPKININGVDVGVITPINIQVPTSIVPRIGTISVPKVTSVPYHLTTPVLPPPPTPTKYGSAGTTPQAQAPITVQIAIPSLGIGAGGGAGFGGAGVQRERLRLI